MTPEEIDAIVVYRIKEMMEEARSFVVPMWSYDERTEGKKLKRLMKALRITHNYMVPDDKRIPK
jgi:hypothetical protein